MDRSRLDQLSFEELKNEALSYGLVPASSCEQLIDQIMSHLERNGPVSDFGIMLPDGTSSCNTRATVQPQQSSDIPSARSTPLVADPSMQQMFGFFSELMKQQSDLMQQVTNLIAATRISNTNPQIVSSSDSSGAAILNQRPVLASVPVAQAVNLLASQLPSFSGSEDENIDIWIEKVERVSRIHDVSDQVTLLAASSKLNKSAKDWLDLNSGTVNDSWFNLKQAISQRFKRDIPFRVTFQKVESRKWNFSKESFQDYAMQKLKLLQNIRLPEKQSIDFLISGIGSPSLRASATLIQAETIDQFLDKMHSLTLAFGDPSKKTPPVPVKPVNSKDYPKKEETTCKTSPPSDSSKELFCVYCRTKGHTRDNCSRLKKKEQNFPGNSSGNSSAVASIEETSSSQSSETSQSFQSLQPIQSSQSSHSPTVAFVDIGSPYRISDNIVKVTAINETNCSLDALIDTGSAVSFIRPSIFSNLINQPLNQLKAPSRSFKALNKSIIKVFGEFTFDFQLAIFPNKTFKVPFLVLEDDELFVDLILGRDFLQMYKIVIVCETFGNENSKIQLFSEIASLDDNSQSVLPGYSDETIFESDFGPSVDEKLVSLIREVENTSVIPIEDGHAITVSLKDNTTYAYSPRRFAWSERRQIREITDDLLQRGIIKPSISPYCARVVPVIKKNGTMRLCIDLRPLNDRVIKQKYPFPLMEDCFSRLGNKKVFTLLDLKDGFHQIDVHPDHSKYFAFATPDGQFEYTKLPFGYCEAPAEFQKRMIQIFQPLLREDKVLIYIDDILVPSCTVEENLSSLKEVFLILKQYRFKLNYKKCHFLKEKIEYLGYILSPSGITLSDRHVKAVRDFPIPKNITQLQRFLGLANFFRKFIRDYAVKGRPLHNLLRKSVSFNFNDDCLKAFQILKQELISYPVLRLYDPYAETELHTDASSLALAAILFQKQESGKLAPIAYYSQATNSAEARYHSFELEMLAVVKAVERFHIFLYGLEFTIVTDCHALVYAVNKAHLNPRFARWTLRLQNYRFKILHRSGQKMAHVDALSRISEVSALVEALPLERELEVKQLQDPRIKEIAEQLEFSDNPKFELIRGLVYRKDSNLPRFAVPESMIDNVIRIYHDDLAHCGLEKAVQGLSVHYWFPSLHKRVHDHISKCVTCLTSNSGFKSSEGEMQITDTPSEPFRILHMDHFGPLCESSNGSKHILVIIDAFTRYVWLFSTKSTTSKEVIKHLTSLFHILGFPEKIVSDRGTAFTSHEFSEFLSSRNIKHRLIAVAAPWANGLAERANRFLKSSLKKLVNENRDWEICLETVQYVFNNTRHSALKSSPSKLLLGYDQRNNTDADLVKFLNEIAGVEIDFSLEREKDRELALNVAEKIKSYNKLYYDKHHRKPMSYKPGDLVMIRDVSIKAGECKKLKPDFKGPFRVTKVLDKNRYVVQDIPGSSITSRPYNSILSPDRLKLWIKAFPNHNHDVQVKV